MDKFIKDYWSIILGVLIAAGSLAVAQYRVGEIESRLEELKGEPLKLVILERDVGRMKCEIGNVKRILRNQPEIDC